jgi:hypothetical protein
MLCTTTSLLIFNNRHSCVWGGNQNRCEDRSSATRSSDFCKKNNDCKVDEICVPLSFSSDPCLDTLGQCILRPNTCPSTDNPVCGCDGKTYSNPCKCLKAGEKVKYGYSCSPERDRDFQRYVRDLDDPYEYTEDLIKQYTYSSLSTNGDTCLTVQECKKQSLDIDHRNSFRVVSDPNNCGCFEWEGAVYWSDDNKCSDQKKRAVSLQNTRKRVRCDLNRIYQDVRNVPIDTCLQASECDAQCYHDIRSHTKMKTDRSSNICGCYRRGNQCYYNSCGNNQKKADKNLPASYSRVWCEDRVRDVRDLVYDTCLTQDECNEQGEINGDVKTPAMVKDFGNDHICGCYEKGGQLYWARCDVSGDFYGELNNQNTRVHCVDVETRRRSYRVFDQEHSHSVSILLFFFQSFLLR